MNVGNNAGNIGHNTQDITIETEVRLFNSLFSYCGEPKGQRRLRLPAGSSLGDLLRQLGIPPNKVYLSLVNGRDITPRLEGGIETEHPLQDGDVVALSGPVPYSWGYGSPVV